MPWEEKRSWVYLVVVIGTYVGYVAVVLGRAGEGPLTEVDWGWPLALSIVASIGATIVGAILAAIVNPSEADRTDERDEAIHVRGDRVGYVLVGVGSLVTIALAAHDADPFWIGNAIYLANVIAAVVSTVIKLVIYRRGY